MATKMVLACSHSRSLQLLARLDARTEFEILEHSLKGGVEAGRAHHCKGTLYARVASKLNLNLLALKSTRALYKIYS